MVYYKTGDMIQEDIYCTVFSKVYYREKQTLLKQLYNYVDI